MMEVARSAALLTRCPKDNRSRAYEVGHKRLRKQTVPVPARFREVAAGESADLSRWSRLSRLNSMGGWNSEQIPTKGRVG
jgi:hypothetical protein